MKTLWKVCMLLLVCWAAPAVAQTAKQVVLPDAGGKFLLHDGWMARRASEIGEDGNRLTSQPFQQEGWMKAKVPGTVLTTLLENGVYPAPEVGLNNELIPDIAGSEKGRRTHLVELPGNQL